MSNARKTNKPADLPKEQTENVVAQPGETADSEHQAATMDVGGTEGPGVAKEEVQEKLSENAPLMTQEAIDAQVEANKAGDMEKQRQEQQAVSQSASKEVTDEDILESMRQAKDNELSDYIQSGGQHAHLAQQVLNERKPKEGHYQRQQREQSEKGE